MAFRSSDAALPPSLSVAVIPPPSPPECAVGTPIEPVGKLVKKPLSLETGEEGLRKYRVFTVDGTAARS